jgi:hypothetical protein
LTQQTGQPMATVLAGACIGESVGTRVSQSQGVVQLAIGKQPRIGRDRRAAKLKHQAVVEIEPQNAPDPLHPAGPPFLPRPIPHKMLNSSP